jgi:hypothetical protein
MYEIKEYTKARAKQLGLKVKPSKSPLKKIDVFQGDKKIASVGDIRYGDYPTYIKEMGHEYASQRQIAYHKRHKKDSKTGRGFLAAYLLW